MTTQEPSVLPGAEPFTAEGGSVGVLVLHGFTGSPQSMRGLAQAFADAGFTVELPLLPGHGTSVDDLERTEWADWSTTAQAAYTALRARCDSVVVAGLSMGGLLAVWLAVHQPGVAGVIAINAAVQPADDTTREYVRQSLAGGVTRWPAVGNDIADPEATELAYDEVPVEAMASLFPVQDELLPQLSRISAPVLAFWSPQDHVVANASSELLVTNVSGPAELVRLERSFHVATLDFDRDLIFRRSVDFVQALAASGD
jgi:carboxylesterase